MTEEVQALKLFILNYNKNKLTLNKFNLDFMTKSL